MKPNGKKRDAHSELDVNTAVLRIVDLRHDLKQELVRARQDAETKVRRRFEEKEKAIMERVGPTAQATVENRVRLLWIEESLGEEGAADGNV